MAVLFTGNAFLSSDRLWNYIDYSAISEQAAIDSAREITVCMPTEMTVKGTHDVVKLKKGDKVKLLARYQVSCADGVQRRLSAYIQFRGDAARQHHLHGQVARRL